MEPPFDPQGYLDGIAGRPDAEIDPALGALALSSFAHPGLSMDRYVRHLKKLARDTGERHASLLASGEEDTARTRVESLRFSLHETQGYRGDEEEYDDLQNADLVRVIDRRRGMPIALCILYIHAGRTLGWDVHGLNIPGHFAARLDLDGQRLIFDPFGSCAVLDAAGLRGLVKKALGPGAELSAGYYEPAGNRAMLIRLQNNIKLRLIESEDYEGALRAVETMRRIDPGEYRLLLDAGVLNARTGRPRAAMEALEAYIEKAPDIQDRHDAALLLREIREGLH